MDSHKKSFSGLILLTLFDVMVNSSGVWLFRIYGYAAMLDLHGKLVKLIAVGTITLFAAGSPAAGLPTGWPKKVILSDYITGQVDLTWQEDCYASEVENDWQWLLNVEHGGLSGQVTGVKGDEIVYWAGWCITGDKVLMGEPWCYSLDKGTFVPWRCPLVGSIGAIPQPAGIMIGVSPVIGLILGRVLK